MKILLLQLINKNHNKTNSYTNIRKRNTIRKWNTSRTTKRTPTTNIRKRNSIRRRNTSRTTKWTPTTSIRKWNTIRRRNTRTFTTNRIWDTVIRRWNTIRGWNTNTRKYTNTKDNDTPEIEINEQPFVTVTPKTIRPEHKAIFWWTSPIETADDVRPKYEIHPNELYFMINKEEKLIYYYQNIETNMGRHGLLYLDGLTLRILQKKIVGQIFKRSFASKQFVIFKPLTYCFKETMRFNVKASFASRL